MRISILVAMGAVFVAGCTSSDLYSSSRPDPASNFGLNTTAAIEYVSSVCIRAERESRTVDDLMNRWPRPISEIDRTGLLYLDKDSSGPKYRLNGTPRVMIADLDSGCHLVAGSGSGPTLREKVAEIIEIDPQVWEHKLQLGETRRDDTRRDLWCSQSDFNGPPVAVILTSHVGGENVKQIPELIMTTFVAGDNVPCELSPVR